MFSSASHSVATAAFPLFAASCGQPSVLPSVVVQPLLLVCMLSQDAAALVGWRMCLHVPIEHMISALPQLTPTGVISEGGVSVLAQLAVGGSGVTVCSLGGVIQCSGSHSGYLVMVSPEVVQQGLSVLGTLAGCSGDQLRVILGTGCRGCPGWPSQPTGTAARAPPARW